MLLIIVFIISLRVFNSCRILHKFYYSIGEFIKFVFRFFYRRHFNSFPVLIVNNIIRIFKVCILLFQNSQNIIFIINIKKFYVIFGNQIFIYFSEFWNRTKRTGIMQFVISGTYCLCSWFYQFF